jgi:hypothetical protein
MPKIPINYAETVIYKIILVETGENLYVGSTTNFIQRKYSHKTNCNVNTKDSDCPIYKHIKDLGGWHLVDMVMVEEYKDCKNNLQKLKREREWIDKENPRCNKTRPVITVDEYKEYQKQYHTETQYHKIYYEENKDEMIRKQGERQKNDHYKEYQRQYHSNRKDIQREYMREYRKKQKEIKQDGNTV